MKAFVFWYQGHLSGMALIIANDWPEAIGILERDVKSTPFESEEFDLDKPAIIYKFEFAKEDILEAINEQTQEP